MPDIPNEETIYVCADALYNVLADHCTDLTRRAALLDSFYEYELAEAPDEVNALFKQMAFKCLTIRTATAVGAET